MSRELAKTYNPDGMEERLYKKWEENGYFHAEADRSRKPNRYLLSLLQL